MRDTIVAVRETDTNGPVYVWHIFAGDKYIERWQRGGRYEWCERELPRPTVSTGLVSRAAFDRLMLKDVPESFRPNLELGADVAVED